MKSRRASDAELIRRFEELVPDRSKGATLRFARDYHRCSWLKRKFYQSFLVSIGLLSGITPSEMLYNLERFCELVREGRVELPLAEPFDWEKAERDFDEAYLRRLSNGRLGFAFGCRLQDIHHVSILRLEKLEKGLCGIGGHVRDGH